MTSCTTVRRDDHSYTYIHNFNSNSGESPTKQLKDLKEDGSPKGDYPHYDHDMNESSAVIDNTPTKTSSSVIHNHYHHNEPRVASYNPPPSYSGFSPSARRYLIQGEVR